MNLLHRIRDWRTKRKEHKEKEKERDEQAERDLDQAYEDWENRLMPLPVEEARRRAEALLDNPGRFRYEETPPTDEDRRKLASLAPFLREFLERYSLVKAVEDNQYLSRDLEGAGGPFLALGHDLGFDQLLVKPREEAIYHCGEGRKGPEPDRLCDSIYHYLLYVDRMNEIDRPATT